MKYSIIVSVKDLAGMNIKERLLECFDFTELEDKFNDYPVYKLNNIFLYTINKDTVNYENLENEIKSDFFIFATRHQSVSGEKTLSVHVPGNYSIAEFGGYDKELCTCPANLIKQAFINLNKLSKETDYKVTLEATHHGPLIRKPVIFIEIGSKEEQWKNKKAGNIIAKTIIKTINQEEKSYETAIGFGGSHYCSGFNKIELNSNIALSHICPKYTVDSLEKEMIQKMIKATYEKIDFALIDWKGLNGQGRSKIINLLEKLNISWKKTKEFK